MRAVTNPHHQPGRTLALQVLGGYVAVASCANAWRLLNGGGSMSFLAIQIALGGAVVMSLRSKRRVAAVVGDWLPLIALPLLYWGWPWATIGRDGRLFDSVVQGWDRALFGTDPASTFAGAFPSPALSELLHLAYLGYYGIIYLPPAILYLSGGRRGFHETVLAFTVTMVASLVAFNVFPVEGPRYAWPAPPGVPSGPVRSFALYLLEGGSVRGTAFPSSHVAIAMAQTLSCLRWRRGPGVIVAITTILLGIGAVYGGFHYASDIVAGALLGLVMWMVARAATNRQ